MGFSVTISSSIILISFIIVFTSFAWSICQSLNDISEATNNYFTRERERLDASLTLSIESIGVRTSNLRVKNAGSRTLFFRNQNGFNWNTIVISYANNSKWRSYQIEDYLIIEIKVSNSSVTFNVGDHSFINPSEEALISFALPENAPDIPLNAVVCAAFVTHYGVIARTEVVREQ